MGKELFLQQCGTQTISSAILGKANEVIRSDMVDTPGEHIYTRD